VPVKITPSTNAATAVKSDTGMKSYPGYGIYEFMFVCVGMKMKGLFRGSNGPYCLTHILRAHESKQTWMLREPYGVSLFFHCSHNLAKVAVFILGLCNSASELHIALPSLSLYIIDDIIYDHGCLVYPYHVCSMQAFDCTSLQ